MVGYRLVSGVLVASTSDTEVSTLGEALTNTTELEAVNKHLHRALELLSDRKSPDYRNSIKESISAVEALCRKLTVSNATLGDCLKRLEQTISIHGALRDGFMKIYGWTSDAEGIRHSLMEEPNLNCEDAKFMAVTCSAFVNYLVAKADQAGIRLT
jgi:hypothetical protein